MSWTLVLLDEVFKWLTNLPGWVWIVVAIVWVGNRIDRRLARIWELVYDLHEEHTSDDSETF